VSTAAARADRSRRALAAVLFEELEVHAADPIFRQGRYIVLATPNRAINRC